MSINYLITIPFLTTHNSFPLASFLTFPPPSQTHKIPAELLNCHNQGSQPPTGRNDIFFYLQAVSQKAQRYA